MAKPVRGEASPVSYYVTIINVIRYRYNEPVWNSSDCYLPHTSIMSCLSWCGGNSRICWRAWHKLLCALLLLGSSPSNLHWHLNDDDICSVESSLRSVSMSILSSKLCTLNGDNTVAVTESRDNVDWHDNGEGNGWCWLTATAELDVAISAFCHLFFYKHKWEQQPCICTH